MKSETYEEFVEKFKPKKTTDDCYTPPEIYEVIKDWACREYGIDPDKIVRPFYPGGDYENYDYPDGCVVLDNPPFSILSKICGFYLERNIPFFLFAPSLTSFSGRNIVMRTCHVICDASIVYENGANVKTSFITSFESGVIARTAPLLSKSINKVSDKLRKEKTRNLPKYDYPDYVLTSAMLQRYSKYGIDMKVHKKDCCPISSLDSQKEKKKAIFGGGLLLSERAAAEREAAEREAAERAAAEREAAEREAAEREAAERAAAERWTLSDRELEIVRGLG